MTKFSLGLCLFLSGCALEVRPVSPPPDSLSRASGIETGSSARTDSGVEICPGVLADNSGQSDASQALQRCFDQVPEGSALEFPPGTYRIDRQVILSKGLTLTTRGLWGTPAICNGVLPCARFLAGPDLSDMAMIYGLSSAVRYTIDHLAFDGNRWARLARAPELCARGLGRNVILVEASDSRVQYSMFNNALCGTAIGIALGAMPSTNLVIHSNVFSDNGDHGSMGLWADGLTIGAVSYSYVIDNYFYNNSDVSLILGGAFNSDVTGNVVVQTWQASFGSIWLTNWTVFQPQNSMQWADYRGMRMTRNTVIVGDLSDLAIQVGVLPATGASGRTNIAYLRTLGGRIWDNTIVSNKQMINVSGGGTPDYPVELGYNHYSQTGERLPATWQGRTIPTSIANIQNPWEDSFVRPEDPTLPLSTHDWTSFY